MKWIFANWEMVAFVASLGWSVIAKLWPALPREAAKIKAKIGGDKAVEGILIYVYDLGLKTDDEKLAEARKLLQTRYTAMTRSDIFPDGLTMPDNIANLILTTVWAKIKDTVKGITK